MAGAVDATVGVSKTALRIMIQIKLVLCMSLVVISRIVSMLARIVGAKLSSMRPEHNVILPLLIGRTFADLP